MGDTEADCQALIAHLYEFLDRELAEDACAALQAHLDECPECLRNVEFERAVKDIVRRKCSESNVPDGLIERLRARLSGP